MMTAITTIVAIHIIMCVRGSVPNALPDSFSFIYFVPTALCDSPIITPIVQMKKLRHGEVRKLAGVAKLPSGRAKI